MMIHCKGIGGAPGIAGGKALVKAPRQYAIVKTRVDDIQRELDVLEQARVRCIAKTNQIYETALQEVGEAEAEIFKAHLLMLKDDEFFSQIQETIRSNQANAEWAVVEAKNRLVKLFESMPTVYLQERAADIKDVTEGLLQVLLGLEDEALNLVAGKEPVILVAGELTPSDTIKMDKRYLAGLVTEAGGVTSHSVILAKTLGIPAVVGVAGLLERVKNGDQLLINGSSGEVYIGPDPGVIEKMNRVKAAEDRFWQAARQAAEGPAKTRDGRQVTVCANLEDDAGYHKVLEHFGEGVGLYRSEFLYMRHTRYPSETEQFEAYRRVAEGLQGREVVIRTLDVGGDKQIDYMNLPVEDNPFLGYRAIRICLHEREMFLTQLKAILRASAFGNVKIMFPMIVTVEELRQAKELVEEAKARLRQENQTFNARIEIGIMVETPAAAVLAATFAKEVDFFSIGSNDLIQYVTASDRLNPKVQYLYDSRNLAVLHLIRQVAQAAHGAGIPVSVCGEMASDYKLIPVLVGLGIDKLSMTPGAMTGAKYIIGKLTQSELAAKVRELLNYEEIARVEAEIEAIYAGLNV